MTRFTDSPHERMMTHSRIKKSLVPFLDLRGETPKYIFVRMDAPGVNKHSFDYSWYYQDIPGTGSNGLVQNP